MRRGMVRLTARDLVFGAQTLLAALGKMGPNGSGGVHLRTPPLGPHAGRLAHRGGVDRSVALLPANGGVTVWVADRPRIDLWPQRTLRHPRGARGQKCNIVQHRHHHRSRSRVQWTARIRHIVKIADETVRALYRRLCLKSTRELARKAPQKKMD